jgi:hypothetical protein
MNFRKRKTTTPATPVMTTLDPAPEVYHEPAGLPKPKWTGGISDAAVENFSNARAADKSTDGLLRNMFKAHPGF